VNPLFGHWKLTSAGLARVEHIRQNFEHLLLVVEKNSSPGREQSIARTKLEEACMFAIKAVCIDPLNQEAQ
jgi:hypothetical protein